MSEQGGSKAEIDREVEAHLLKEALATGAAAAAVFAGTSQAQWQPAPGASQGVVMPEPGVDPAVHDPGPGGGAGASVELIPDAVDRAVANLKAAKAKAKAGKTAKKPPLTAD
jgi:hypothetical protein